LSKNNDREHFEDYRDQTRVKHEILAAYLPAYFNILKKWSKNLVYIDAFAGRGTYTNADTGEVIDGSPLRALRLIAANTDFADRVTAIFVESDAVLFGHLEATVGAFLSENPNVRKPLCVQGTFAERIGELIQHVPNLAPTFLFVDPCGVSGASFERIKNVMNCDKCEAFIFFNIDGVRRIAGLKDLSQTLVDLLGSTDRATRLYEALRSTADVTQREELILSHYREALRDDAGAQYTVPFRVESEDRQKTSHYLIHASKHYLGFRIMKDVMWRRGHSETEVGALEFRQAGRTNFIPLFDPSESIKQEIVGALKNGAIPVSTFYKNWVNRPEDLLCESAYRALLLEMEAASQIQVLKKDGLTVVSVDERRKIKGKPTLGEDCFVRLMPD